MVRLFFPFAPFEWMIAWRYLRAKRATGGISVMTWISLLGITLAVFALIVTLAVRAGLKSETTRIILGASAHLEVRYTQQVHPNGVRDHLMRDYGAIAARINNLPGIQAAVPVVKGHLIASLRQNHVPIELYGITPGDLYHFPSIGQPEAHWGDIKNLPQGIALGRNLAQDLGARVGDSVRIILPNGVRTAFGSSPRISAYEVVYIFQSGHRLIDSTRAYLPLDDAQKFFNREGGVDQIDIMLRDPEQVTQIEDRIIITAGPAAYAWSWRDRAGGMLRALELQDNALYILLFVLLLIATLNIISGLIMLVKNKGRDIGILRTIGLSRGSVLRIFILIGASIGMAGTLIGAVSGVIFALNIEHVYVLMDALNGNARARLEAQGFFFPPAIIRPLDLAGSIGLSLLLSFVVTIFPARRAAWMSPVEALRYE